MDTGAMTRGGAAVRQRPLLLTALVTLVLALADDPGDLLHRKTYVTRPMLLIAAAALLAPVAVRPLTRLLTWLPARLPGATGLLVRENAAAGVRRTAALAAPVLVTVALTGSLLGAVATLDGAKAAEARERTTAAFVATAPSGADGFDAAAVERLRAVPGARISPSASSAGVRPGGRRGPDPVSTREPSPTRVPSPRPPACRSRRGGLDGPGRPLDHREPGVGRSTPSAAERVRVRLGDRHGEDAAASPR